MNGQGPTARPRDDPSHLSPPPMPPVINCWCHGPSKKPACLVLTVALVGTTITSDMVFYVGSAAVDKGIRPVDYPKERADSASGSLVLDAQVFNTVVTAILPGFIPVLADRKSVLGAATSGPRLRAVGTVYAGVIGRPSRFVMVESLAGR
jgi:hypothetical protein